MSSNIVNFSYENAKKNTRENKVDEVLNGLGKGEVGFLVGPPGLGKSFVSLSIGYEVVTSTPFIGLLPVESKPKKVLYVPYEDKLHNLNSRMVTHESNLSDYDKSLVEANFACYNDFSPLLNKFTTNDRDMRSDSVNSLIEAAKDYDLLILDTARGALGGFSEVEGDILFKLITNEIATKANVAVLVNHHTTKTQTANYNEVNSTGGSGLSTCQSESKFILFLRTFKINRKESLGLVHIKANYINPDHLATDDNPFFLDRIDNLLVNKAVFSEKRHTKPSKSSKQTKKNIQRKVLVEKLQSDLDDIELDEELMKNVMESESKKSDHASQDPFDTMFMGEK